MSKILNNLICSVMIFALTFLWAYFCLKDAFWSTICAATITVSLSYILWKIASKRENGKKIKQKRKKDIANLAEYLKFGENNAELFADLFNYYGFETEKIDFDNYIAYKDSRKNYVAVCFEQDTLNKDRLRQAVVSAKRHKADKLYIFTNKTDPSAEKTAANYITTAFIDGINTYALFEQCDKLPSTTIKPIKKTSLIGKYALCRQRFGWYCASCIFMVIVSVFSYFPGTHCLGRRLC